MSRDYKIQPDPTDPSVKGERIFDPIADHTAENAKPFNVADLDFSSAEAITVSLEIVAKAVADRTVTPAMGKSIATIAGTSLRSISLSVAKQIKALQDQYRSLEAEKAGRRRGI
jgi:hypothetical protein